MPDLLDPPLTLLYYDERDTEPCQRAPDNIADVSIPSDNGMVLKASGSDLQLMHTASIREEL
jgi:hypothetical protein